VVTTLCEPVRIMKIEAFRGFPGPFNTKTAIAL